MRVYAFTMSTGRAYIEIPEQFSQEDSADLMLWLEIVKRSISRIPETTSEVARIKASGPEVQLSDSIGQLG